MPDIRADGIAVYVYRRSPQIAPASAGKKRPTRRRSKDQYEFLQIRRSALAGGYQHSWQTVYGGVEKTRTKNGKQKPETAIQAALRELKEETNLTPIRMFQVEFLETFYFKPEDYVLVMPVFGVEVKRSDKITLNREHTAHRWVPESQIDSAFMWRTQKEALHHLLDYLHHGSDAAHFLEIPIQSSEYRL